MPLVCTPHSPWKGDLPSGSPYHLTLTQSLFPIIVVRHNCHNIEGAHPYNSLNIYIFMHWESSLDQDISVSGDSFVPLPIQTFCRPKVTTTITFIPVTLSGYF